MEAESISWVGPGTWLQSSGSAALEERVLLQGLSMYDYMYCMFCSSGRIGSICFMSVTHAEKPFSNYFFQKFHSLFYVFIYFVVLCSVYVQYFCMFMMFPNFVSALSLNLASLPQRSLSSIFAVIEFIGGI